MRWLGAVEGKLDRNPAGNPQGIAMQVQQSDSGTSTGHDERQLTTHRTRQIAGAKPENPRVSANGYFSIKSNLPPDRQVKFNAPVGKGAEISRFGDL